MKFSLGDEVIVIDGPYKGQYGAVVEYFLGSAILDVTEERDGSVRLMIRDEDLELLPPEQSQSVEDDDTIDIPVFEFGISSETFQRHVEFMIGRSLALVGKVGPKQAFFGFQEFEGKSATEVLLELMLKLEEGMALFTQAHILIGRILAALEMVSDEVE